MTAQLTIYHAIAEVEARDLGMDKSASQNGDLLHIARGAAFLYCRIHGVVSVEDVRRELDRRIPGWLGGNWLGSVFKEKRWEPTGRWVQTSHKGGHARAVREWRLKSGF